MAGDHGVTAEGVSAFPQAVTAQMVLNFLRGGAAINVLARHAGARLVVVDIGVNAEFPPDTKPADTSGNVEFLRRKIAPGTRNFAREAAMTRDGAVAALTTGIEVVEAEIARGAELIATGDMGIGNTAASSAIVATLTGQPVAKVTGRGTGINDAGLAKKTEVIGKALALHNLTPHSSPVTSDTLDLLAKVGGLEIAGLAGVILGAAAARRPVVLDGFISGAAALIAAGLAPNVAQFCFAAHRSVEAGHRAMLEALGLKPIMDLDLRLGEGTGAALAMHLIEASAKFYNEMATFAEAGVAEKH
jgi:nicotinate-nucleotide--dimethylbenzimidazole phosphoribosyltransferase